MQMTQMNLINNCISHSVSLSLFVSVSSVLFVVVSAHFVCIILMRFCTGGSFYGPTLNRVQLELDRRRGGREWEETVANVLVPLLHLF